MGATKRIFKFQNHGLKKSILGFWSVILTINILTYILMVNFNSKIKIGLFSSKDDIFSIVGGNIMPIFIFFIVYGIIMYHEDFALALSFGVTRKDFYKSVIVNNIIVTLSFAAIQVILQIIDKYFVASLGYKPMVEFGIFNTATDNILFIVLTLSLLFLTFVSVTNLIGVLQYRFGYKFWIGFGITAITLQILGNFSAKKILGFSDMYQWIWSRFNSSTAIFLTFVIAIVCYTLGYFIIRKANIRK